MDLIGMSDAFSQGCVQLFTQSNDRSSVPSPARRHFMAVIAAGAGRLSVLTIASSLPSIFKTKDANALSYPDGDPDRSDPDDRKHKHNCFGRGTLILTPDGEVPVEDLAIGSLVVTTNGAMPVKWIGQTTIKANASASWHPNVLPVRVSQFAIDDQTPTRDLYLSQEHCLLIDGFLIPAKYLVNGRSICFDHSVKMSGTIEYFCVELNTHQVIFAEGMAAESFLYAGLIAWDNLGDYQDLYGNEHETMPAVAPICRYKGGRAELGGLVRLATSRFVDVRDPIQIAYDRIAARAISLAA
jgi:hypothetical protein